MKQPPSPLYPRSSDKGLKGKFEQAVLMDDEQKTYRQKSPKPKSKSKPTKTSTSFAPPITRISPTFKDFNRTQDEIMQNYRSAMKELRRQKRQHEITRRQFRQAHKKLAASTNAEMRHNFATYMVGEKPKDKK